MGKPDEAHVWTDQELEKLEKRIAAKYKIAADEMQDKVTEYFAYYRKREQRQRELLKAGKITDEQFKQWRLAQIGRGKRLEDLRDKLAERMTKANEVTAAYINDKTPGVYSLNRNYAAYTIEQHAGDVGFTLWDEQTVKRMIKERPDLMPYYPPEKAVNRGIDLKWGKQQITAQVTTGILTGESLPKIAKRLEENIPKMERTSAIRAARTAMTGAQNAGRMDSYHAAEEMGIELRKSWLATLDRRTRHTHRILDGQTQEVDSPFVVDGREIMYPGDPNADGDLVWNCRCTMIADLPELHPSTAQRRARDPETGETELIEDMTYKEWEEWKKKRQKVEEKTIAGVKRGKPMSFKEADTKHVNPKYGTTFGYSINCQSCVPTFEARLRGYNVIAKANTQGSMCSKLARKTNLVWIDPQTGEHPEYIKDEESTTPKKYLKFLNQTVKEGERYSIEFVWKGRQRSGHIVNLDRAESGKLRIHDNQRGEGERDEWVGDEAVLKYLSQMKYKTSVSGYKFPTVPKLLRIDNMDFDFSVADQIMEGAE